MKIYYPNDIHMYTIIILHGMYNDSSCFKIISEKILEINKHIKIIVPDAPILNISWPDGKEYNINSWYNYYTRRNGEMLHDDIDIFQYQNQSNRIIKIIKKEGQIIPLNKIILMGESQGGTIVSNIASIFNIRLAGYILLDSIFMDNILKNKIDYTIIDKNIYIYSSENDEVYCIELQKKSVKNLFIENRISNWFIDKGTQHSEIGPNRDNFIIKTIKKILSI